MTSPHKIPSFDVLGVRVHLVRIGQVLAEIEKWVGSRQQCRYIVATQMHGVMESQRDPEFKKVLNSADLFIPDGFSLVLAARCRGYKLGQRVPGPDIFSEGCKLAAKQGYSIFLYGDTEETLGMLTTELNTRFPGIKIAGSHSPPFRPLTLEEDEQIIRTINESRADIVWVGLGLPKQELWMYEHQDKLNAPVLIGVGAAFKFFSGQVKRAPDWMGNHGLEWLWRFYHEPLRVWRRVLIDAPHFFIRVLFESLILKLRSI